jgi:hypothetical protein
MGRIFLKKKKKTKVGVEPGVLTKVVHKVGYIFKFAQFSYNSAVVAELYA